MKTNWDKIDPILDQLINTPTHEREEKLRSLTEGDDQLYNEVKPLLNSLEQTLDFMQTNALGSMKDFAGSIIQDDQSKQIILNEGDQLGKYRISGLVGEGGMGNVYLAERSDGVFERKVALKVLKNVGRGKAFESRFRDEQRIHAKLQHPGIIRLYDAGIENKIPYIVMEYAEGKTLLNYIRDNNLNLDQKLELFDKICDIVSYAHRNLVIHCDLKPGNIIITDDGNPKLLDFGVSNLLDKNAADRSESRPSGSNFVSLAFAAPEQVRGEPVTTATDVYSLGLILHIILTGGLPYKFNSSDPDTIKSVICTPIDKLPTSHFKSDSKGYLSEKDQAKVGNLLRRDLGAIIINAIENDPADRYKSVEGLRKDLSRFRAGFPVSAVERTGAYVFSCYLKRNWLPLSAAAVLVLALTGLLTYHINQITAERNLAQLQAERAAEIKGLVTDILSRANTYETPSDVVSLRDVLDDAAERLESAPLADRQVEAELHEIIGYTFTRIGEAQYAVPHLEKALEIRRKYADEDEVALAVAKAYLGTAYTYRVRIPESIELLEKSIELFERHEATAPDAYAGALLYMALMQAEFQEFEKSIAYFEKAKSVHLSAFPDGNQYTTWIYGNYGSVLAMIGELEQSAEYARKAVYYGRKYLGDESIATAQQALALAGRLNLLGIEEEPLEYYYYAYDIYSGHYGKDHPRTFDILKNLSNYNRTMGNFEKAFEYVDRYYSKASDYFGEDTRQYSDVLYHMGLLYNARYHQGGKDIKYLELSEEYYRKCLALRKEVIGEPHHLIAQTHLGFASTLSHLGKYDEAHESFAYSRDTYEELFPNGHFAVAITLHNWGNMYRNKGNYPKAIEKLEEARRVYLEELGLDHHRTRTGLEHLARAYEEAGMEAEAESVLAKLENSAES